jgi:hypothetical protein
MNGLMVVLRLVHIVSGGLWVGMMAFTVVFLTPALRDVGPDGAKVMAALQRRHVLVVVPILALATLISGMWLFSRFSGGFPLVVLHSAVGLAFGLGGAAALIAFVLGIALMRPATARAAALVEALGSAKNEQERAARTAEIQRLRGRAASVGVVVAVLLVFALGAMAVARYL